MSKVKARMLEIIDSLPQDYFDNKSNTETMFVLIKNYLDKYGNDETTIIPGTNKHFSIEMLQELLNTI